jgi:hypothetical protein
MINLQELFSAKQDISVNYCGTELLVHLRQPTDKEHLEYRRRVSEMKIRGGAAQPTDVSLNSGLWLFDAICEGVTAIDGDDRQEVPDFREKIPTDLKLAVINSYLNRLEIHPR